MKNWRVLEAFCHKTFMGSEKRFCAKILTSMIFYTILLSFYVCFSNADNPANCTYEEIKGTWIIYKGKTGETNKVDCNLPVEPINKSTVHLLFPDIAVDEEGNQGFWTMIYNQGFELVINKRKYFAFSFFKKIGKKVISLCDRTFNGWAHDVVKDNKFPPKNWGCYYGKKVGVEKVQPKVHYSKSAKNSLENKKLYKTNEKFIQKINEVQTSWKATAYEEYNEMTIGDLMQRGGGSRKHLPAATPSLPSKETLEAAALLPEEFDWRNVSNINYVSPVRNQASCGSCYAFASMAMLEARFRIKSKNVMKPVFSTQNIVSCSEYSQGCKGGFPYLVGGKYSEDFGNIVEECYPYEGKDSKCSPLLPHCRRFNATNYYYIGGFYGACNEPLMRLELVRNGPFAIAFEVYNDFFHYKSGVYQHTGLKNNFFRLEVTNHAVLVVGYGVDQRSGIEYWTVKNSWGTSWGEKGFFRIRRGVDECSCESTAVGSSPVL